MHGSKVLVSRLFHIKVTGNKAQTLILRNRNMLTCNNMRQAHLSPSSVQAARRETILGATLGGNVRTASIVSGKKHAVSCSYLDMIKFSFRCFSLSVDESWYPSEGLQPCSHAITGLMETGCSNKQRNMEKRDGVSMGEVCHI